MEQGYSSYPYRAHLASSWDHASYHPEQVEHGLEVAGAVEEAQRLRCERRASLVEAVADNAVMVVEGEEPEQREEEPAGASRQEDILRWGPEEDQGGLV